MKKNQMKKRYMYLIKLSLLMGLFRYNKTNYRNIPKISPSMCKPLQIEAPQTHNAKKTKKNGKFPSKNNAIPIGFETQISLCT